MKKKDKRFTNADLMEFFEIYADRYFGGNLQRPANLSFASIPGLGHTFRYRIAGKRRSKGDSFGIHISNKLRYSRRLWATTLLHEMVHLEQQNAYGCGIRGKHFNDRMAELAVAGAFNGLW